MKSLKEKEQNLKAAMKKEPAVIIGESPRFMRVLEIVAKVAKTDANVLITGENGTGKEVIARELHRQSSRANEVMVSVDMGSNKKVPIDIRLVCATNSDLNSLVRKGEFREDLLYRINTIQI